MNRKYNLRLDLQFRCNNSTIKFRQSDNNTSDFFMRVTIGGKLLDIDKAIVVLATIKPNMTSQAQFLEVKDGKIYADLNANMKDQVGNYKAQALLILENERVATDIIEYEVTEDNILNQLESTVQSTEEFTMLRDMLNRLSIIETSEMSRVENEENREKAEKLRKDVIEKIKLDVNKLIEDTNLKLANSLKSNTDKVDTLVRDANKKIDDNLETNTNTVNKLVTDTQEKINSYKNEKDKELNDNLTKYKNDTTKNIYDEFDTYELDTNEVIKENLTNHKNQSNLDIRKILTDNINVKNKEFDDNIKIKNIQVDNKLKEVDVAEKNREAAETKRAEDHIKREEFLNSFESQLETIESKNAEQDIRLNQVEYVDKRQDVLLSGLMNENNDGRLSITGEGNSIKLENSKDGVVEVNSVKGNTMVNIAKTQTKTRTLENITSSIECVTSDRFNHNLDPNKIYTLITTLTVSNLIGDSSHYTTLGGKTANGSPIWLNPNITERMTEAGTKLIKVLITGVGELNKVQTSIEPFNGSTVTATHTIDGFTILEGDYTNKPIPDSYVEGMQSTFEDKLVTQEMVTSGEESVENLGKYKAEVSVVGKNLFNVAITRNFINNITGTQGGYTENHYTSDFINVSKLVSIIISSNENKQFYEFMVFEYDINKKFINKKSLFNSKYVDLTLNNDTKFIRISIYDSVSFTLDNLNFQIEENTVSTQYEPYKEFKHVSYLDEPLYQDNELCVHEGKLGYWKNRFRIMMTHDREEFGYYLNTSLSNDITSLIIVNSIPNLCDKIQLDILCNKLMSYNCYDKSNVTPGICSHNKNSLLIRVLNSDLTTQNVTGFLNLLKKWNDEGSPLSFISRIELPAFVPILEDTPKWILDSFNSCTVTFNSNIPVQTSSFTYTGNIPSVYGMDKSITTIEEHNVDMVATSWDMDYRLLEMEWALEGITGVVFNLNNIKIGGKNMALSRFEQAKIMILGGAYDKATLTKQLSRYLEKKILTQVEYDELISLMEAKELVVGE